MQRKGLELKTEKNIIRFRKGVEDWVKRIGDGREKGWRSKEVLIFRVCNAEEWKQKVQVKDKIRKVAVAMRQV